MQNDSPDWAFRYNWRFLRSRGRKQWWYRQDLHTLFWITVSSILCRVHMFAHSSFLQTPWSNSHSLSSGSKRQVLLDLHKAEMSSLTYSWSCDCDSYKILLITSGSAKIASCLNEFRTKRIVSTYMTIWILVDSQGSELMEMQHFFEGLQDNVSNYPHNPHHFCSCLFDITCLLNCRKSKPWTKYANLFNIVQFSV